MTTARTRWRDHLQRRVIAAVEAAPPDIRPEVYLVHLMIWTEDRDNRQVVATVAWNTSRHLERAQAGQSDEYLAYLSEIDAYGFAEPEAAVIGSAARDPEGDRLRRAWLNDLGLWYDDGHAGLAVTHEDPLIWDGFLEIVVEVARALHIEGHLQRLLGRDVPVLIDAGLGDDDEMRALNRSANPSVFHETLDRWTARHDV